MATLSTEVCNLAIGHLGISTEIGNVETEKSAEANACRRYYSVALRRTLRDFDWPFTTKIGALGLVTDSEDATHPTTEWAYQYQLPSDSLYFRRILSQIRNDNHESKVPYREYHGDSGTTILTDQEDAIGEWTIEVSDPTRWPDDFKMAFSYMLAHLIATKITKGDPFKLGDKAMQLYMAEVMSARANAKTEEQPDLEPEAGSIRAREA